MRNVFKKYSFTVSAVVLAVGPTIGVIVSALTRSLKPVAKEVGDGFQTHGSKKSCNSPRSHRLNGRLHF